MPGSSDSAPALLAALNASLPAAMAPNQADQTHAAHTAHSAHTAHWQARDLQRLADFSPTHLLYLHGFRSSAQSAKARCMAAWLARHRPEVQWHCPNLSPSPAEAMASVQAWLADVPPGRCALMGSSLGGFYAAWLARQWNLPAVLINPAVHPARDLAACIGVHPAWHDPSQRIHFEPAFVDALRELESRPGPFEPPVLTLIAQGDEVLDWREMMDRHGTGSHLLIEGGDHALSDFERWLPVLTRFLRLA